MLVSCLQKVPLCPMKSHKYWVHLHSSLKAGICLASPRMCPGIAFLDSMGSLFSLKHEEIKLSQQHFLVLLAWRSTQKAGIIYDKPLPIRQTYITMSCVNGCSGSQPIICQICQSHLQNTEKYSIVTAFQNWTFCLFFQVIVNTWKTMY